MDHATVLKWLWSVKDSGDIERLHETRKQLQAAMFEEITQHLMPVESEEGAVVVRLLVHFFSGRATLPSFKKSLKANRSVSLRAEHLFHRATSGKPLPSKFVLTAVYNCSVEIVTEAIEEHYQDALLIADHGVSHWPKHAELWRQRGVLKLTQDDYSGALADLEKARSIKPDLHWLNEPIALAQARA